LPRLRTWAIDYLVPSWESKRIVFDAPTWNSSSVITDFTNCHDIQKLFPPTKINTPE
jgi:hypothetical protein